MADRALESFRESIKAAGRDIDGFRAGLRDAAKAAYDSVSAQGTSGVVAGAKQGFSVAEKAGESGVAGAIGGALAGGAAAAEAAALKAVVDEGVALLSVGVKNLFPELVNAVKGIQDARNAQEQTVSLAQEMAAFGIQASPELIQEDFESNLAANLRRTQARTAVEAQLGNESAIIAAKNSLGAGSLGAWR